VSFEIMRSRGIRRVFCFDSHFSEQRFEAETGPVEAKTSVPDQTEDPSSESTR
jgi:hypothetical protein